MPCKIMRFFIVALSASCLVSTSIQAVLPPYYQSLKEYQALLDDPQLKELFNSAEMLVDIKREEKRFIIETSQNILIVTVEYEKPTQPGPAIFKFTFGSPIPLPHKEK